MSEPVVELPPIPSYPLDALPAVARELVDHGARVGLPPALVAGAALAAAAGAIGSNARLVVLPSWAERAILWVPLLAPSGGAKTPSQSLAFAPLRGHDAQLDDSDDEELRYLLTGDTTMSALARDLAVSGGALTADIDELDQLLCGIGEYSSGTTGDRGRLLALWPSERMWVFKRVGDGKKQNAVALRIGRPTLVICGTLQTARHELLGSDDGDGLRPRWLPHLAERPDGDGDLEAGEPPVGWQLALGRGLIPNRHVERTWRFDDDGRRAFQQHRQRWKEAAGGVESEGVSLALVKADVHLARVALTFVELERPAAGGVIGADLVDRAAIVVDFTIDSWRALPTFSGLELTSRGWHLSRAVAKLADWLERRNLEWVPRRELLRAHVGGVRTADQLDALLYRYREMFPGCIRDSVVPEGGGTPTQMVTAPRRGGAHGGVATGDTGTRSAADKPANPQSRAENGAAAAGDSGVASFRGDTVFGDTGRPLPCGHTGRPKPTMHGWRCPTCDVWLRPEVAQAAWIDGGAA